jgi:L-aspartate oxidase
MKTDFLVIGSGISGLNFAIKAAKYGEVTVVTKKEIVESNTNYAQGGIASVIGKDDSFQLHLQDTLRTGCGLSNKRLVKILVKNGPREIQDLIFLGVNFDKKYGEFALGREGGHSRNRVLHIGDMTGREIERVLVQNVRRNKKIDVLENHFAIDLITKDKKCCGVWVLDKKNDEVIEIFSRVTVIAAGGIGWLYKYTSNPQIATGDGIAMAFRAGSRIEDIEFVQFHPTTLNKDNTPNFLISEAIRGEGAVLLNEDGERFMEKYHEMKELAPRDIVSRAIYNELKKGPVYLDIRHRGEDFIKNRFPTIYKECLKYGIDVTKVPVPVSPAAHYICGGVKTNEYGETNIENLLVVGECACTEVHGANRLASNSLLESLVFSSMAVHKAKEFLKGKIQEKSQKEKLEIYKGNRKKIKNLETELRKSMWEHVGIVRSEEGLKYELEKLEQLEKDVGNLYKTGISVELLELRNMITVGKLITKAALIRKESRGTHYREDYPKTDDKNWLRHIILENTPKGDLYVSFN